MQNQIIDEKAWQDQQSKKVQEGVMDKASVVIKAQQLLRQLRQLLGQVTGPKPSRSEDLLVALAYLLDEDALQALLNEIKRAIRVIEEQLTAESYKYAMTVLNQASALVDDRRAPVREAGGLSMGF